ncbi:unnamed protein product [Adineta ricciae]|uniref:Uncharacterized protein n=1 Tax=Adineta ricciae TaxID=249248 RepID=A0A814H4J7_ADIRI|nr:unnamed protein product [Adineta ricciae]
MSGGIQFVREELHRLQTSLDEDKSTFVTKLNQVRNDVFQHIDKQIQRLRLIQEDSFIQDKRDSNSQFIPINDQPEVQHTTSSIGQSHHKQFAEENNQTNFEPQSRLTSTCSSSSKPDEMIDMSFKIPYKSDRSPQLISFNSDENYFLVYSIKAHKLVYLSNQTPESVNIVLPFNKKLLNFGYSKFHRCFYFTSRQTNCFALFRLNDRQIEIIRELPLINTNEQFISGHIYQNLVHYIYSLSSKVIFAKYDMETSSDLEKINLENHLYDIEENIKYRLIDSTVNESFISCLVQLNSTKKWRIAIYDIKDFERINSFDLIDARNPLSIVSAEKREFQCSATTTTMQNDNAEYSLLFVNDPESHFIHCCDHFQYQTPIQVNAFGICALDDGNLALIGNKDLRGLNVQRYLKQNNVQLFTKED